MTTLEWLDEQEIPWLDLPRRRAVMEAIAEACDTAGEDAIRAVRERSPVTCTESVLAAHGAVVGLTRDAGETVADWRKRIVVAYAMRWRRGERAWLNWLWEDRKVELPADGLRVGFTPIGPTARAWWSSAGSPRPDGGPEAKIMLLYAGAAQIRRSRAALDDDITSVRINHAAGANATIGISIISDPVATNVADATELWIESEPPDGGVILLEVLGGESHRDVAGNKWSALQTRRSLRSAGYPVATTPPWWRVSWATRSVVAGRGPSLGIAGGTVADRAALVTDRLEPYTSADMALHNGG